ncbi:hypothetical protein CIG75_18880 [Tumebacillus algifaecis]|uniref:Uncharacterized protein n=1 Tax=Tumebacillus algifaecis TaxID=1214604 RepID=A0A223D5M5_9BACL|nr:hypothetical protein [Tumebacillus algifaecis]ASS76800.1 hypothetical protein CIG75_18880 [Tumebacillus algifaecis]
MTKKKLPNRDAIAKRIVGKEQNKFNKASNREVIQKFHEDRILFSFWHLDYRSEEAFNLGSPKVDVPWFLLFIDHLKEISKLTRKQLETTGRHYKFHPIPVEEKGYKFNVPVDILDEAHESAFQFGLGKSKGRVYGFMVDNEFYLVWIDREHNLYPDDNYGGYKAYPPVMSYTDLVEEENRALKAKNDTLLQENKELFQMLEDALDGQSNPSA